MTLVDFVANFGDKITHKVKVKGLFSDYSIAKEMEWASLLSSLIGSPSKHHRRNTNHR